MYGRSISRPATPIVLMPDERRILEKPARLDQKPPPSHATWTLEAEALGDVSEHQVWRLLRKHGIQLRRRRSWCISTDPQFAEKAADIAGLHLCPPDNAVLISVDDKPAIQALELSQAHVTHKFVRGT